MSPDLFAEAAAGNARAVVAKAEASARAANVDCSTMVETGDRPHEVILDAAIQAGCDLVFMASHGRRGLKGVILGSVTRKVLERATLPVLVAAVESNMASLTDEQRALAVVRDEHRSLAAVLNVLVRLVDDAARPADPELLHAMLFYIEQFPERLHHPKEDAYLFRKLRERTHECDALIAELQLQHVGGAPRSPRCGAHSTRERWPCPLRARLRHGSAHMDAEESWSRRASWYLNGDDWREIAGLRCERRPRFRRRIVRVLASRMLDLAGRASRQGPR
jgi:hypothetical protein